MVILDTSVWIHLFRRRHSRIAGQVVKLVHENQIALCGQVWVEFVGGFCSQLLRREYSNLLSGYPWLDTPREAFEVAAELRARHQKIGSGDAIIAATAMIHRATLVTADRPLSSITAAGLTVKLVSDQ